MISAFIKKAWIPVAGKGTRLMPLTLHQPKGMVAVLDKPMIHYPLEELRDAGIKHIIITTAPDQIQYKQYISYLKKMPEWEDIRFDFTIQKKPTGSADALLAAQKLLNKEPFVVHFCDNVIVQNPSMTRMLINYFSEFKEPIVPIEKVPKSLMAQYASIRTKKIKKNVYQTLDIIEKPKPEEIISYYSVMPSNILTSDIFPYIHKAKKYFSKKKEIAIADALTLYVREGNPVYGWKFDGIIFNTGLMDGLIKANIYTALKHPEFGKKTNLIYIKSLENKNGVR